MRQIKSDQQIGRGLMHRANHDKQYASLLLKGIVCFQAITVMALFIAAIVNGLSIWYANLHPKSYANAALFLCMLLWFVFLCGGLWHGYWIKLGQIQMVHFTLLILTLISIILVNLPS